MSRRAWAAFAAASLIWGVPYLFIRIAVRGGMTPLMLAWGRVTLAAVVLLVLAWRAGTLGQIRGHLRWLALYAVAEVTVPFPLIAFGEQRVASSLAAIVVASVPLIGAVLAFRFDRTERPTPIRAFGLLIGFGGVIALVGIDVAGSATELLGTAAILVAAVGYAIGPMVIKLRLGTLDPRAAIGGALGIASLLLLPGAVLDRPSRVPSAGAVVSVVVLGLLCTAAAFVILMVLIREAGTSRAMVITYVNPVVAVALGVALLGEQPGAGAVAGLLLILAGSWLSTSGRLPPSLRQFGRRREGRSRRRLPETAVQARVACALAGLACLLFAIPAGAAVPAWTTYRHDMLRSGIDPDSTSPVTPKQVWQTATLDGSIYGSPLVYGSRVYVATENDSVYALDAITGAVIWRRHVGTPVPVVGSNPPTTGCGDINPLGITGTPVIDPATQRIFAVAETWNGSDPNSIQHLLLGFSLADGATVPGLPHVVDVAGSTPRYQLQRPGLALDDGKVVIGFGGNSGDCGDYHGRIVAAAENGGTVDSFSAPSSDSAVWGAGNGLPVDGQGNIWATTGNGDPGTFGFQESVLRLRLTAGLTLADWWAPANWSALDADDQDLASSEPLLLPGGLAFAIGKAGVGYLLNTSNLGHTGGAPVFQADICGDGSFGGGSYANGVIYVTCTDGMHALSLDSQAKTFSPLGGWSVPSDAVGPPIEAGGLIWSAGWHNGTLYGLNPSTGNVSFSQNLGSFDHFATPGAGGGLLFVANDDQVTALRISNTPAPSPTRTTVSSPARAVAAGAKVTFTATVSPAPNAGTVRFTDGTASIAGCAAVAIKPTSGRATCMTSLRRSGAHSLGAVYSGDVFYAVSRAPSISVQVRIVPPPVIAHTRLSGTGTIRTLRFSLSKAGTVTVAVTQRVKGRRVNGRCRTAARHGRGCTVSVRRARFRLHARRGANRFRLNVHRLRAGHYAVRLSAVDSSHLVSRTAHLTLTVAADRRP